MVLLTSRHDTNKNGACYRKNACTKPDCANLLAPGLGICIKQTVDTWQRSSGSQRVKCELSSRLNDGDCGETWDARSGHSLSPPSWPSMRHPQREVSEAVDDRGETAADEAALRPASAHVPPGVHRWTSTSLSGYTF